MFEWFIGECWANRKDIPDKQLLGLSLFQRKTWLREALSELCKGQLDEVEQMKQCLAVLSKEGSERERGGVEEREEDDEDDERETAFEMLSELCENLDNARGL